MPVDEFVKMLNKFNKSSYLLHPLSINGNFLKKKDSEGKVNCTRNFEVSPIEISLDSRNKSLIGNLLVL